uniref:NADH dehydrogenase subunit 6 n=1 Tax=Atractolytocestus huronensis TaxID=507542 RepID=A0A343EST7_9CEST|nr:NADH dehydrogenase subunit 6 [Atractolytocestus huronensis]ASL24623.1 NADH dehydrogenase subunit 6 [Atractolytocestus huronensis]
MEWGIVVGFYLYLFSVCQFLVSTHCVFYCLILVFSSVVSGGLVYVWLGFSWYTVLLCLVYIGGIYILFIFVSVQSPNNLVSLGSWRLGVVVFCGLVPVSYSSVASVSLSSMEASSMLCTTAEGLFYLCLCMTLLFGFVVISVIMSVKPNFYR